MKVLILSSKFDFSCDYVTAALHKIGIPYYRINSEDIPSIQISLDPAKQLLTVRNKIQSKKLSTNNLVSIYYRRPVYYREYGTPQYSSKEMLIRSHWLSFLVNLRLIDNVTWVNKPESTYLAEHKAYQLATAKKLGFRIPKTIITNDVALLKNGFHNAKQLVVKGLDTVMLREKNKETFGFTHIVKRSQLRRKNLFSLPTVVQEFLEPKLDIRVTVIGDRVFAAEIRKSGEYITGDWRINRADIQFLPHRLPKRIAEKSVELLKKLDLKFGAIDMAIHSGSYYFLEINPTGEWAWLVVKAGLEIDTAIAGFLANPLGSKK